MDPAVAACRSAVRPLVATVPPGGLLLAACSGGADSLALAAALLVEAPRAGRRAGVLTVDHGLQPGSDEQATAVLRWVAGRGADPVRLLTVQVGRAGGPEAAARTARYAALQTAAADADAALVLLGHTRDDQAETVLLGLARGSGARSLAGMPAVTGRFARPLLDLDRATTAAACAAEGLPVWADPQNDEPRYARVRIRTHALPALEAAAGPGVAAALARSARLLRDDADALDGWAAQVRSRAQRADGALDVAVLASVPPAVRTRVLRAAAIDAGCPPGATTSAHVDALDALVTRWHGQRAVALPGGVGAVRRCGWLLFTPPDPSAAREAGARTCHDRPVPGTSSRS